MTENSRPIRSESVRLLVNGVRKGKGVVQLYPDKLASSRVMVEYVGIFLGGLAVTAVYRVTDVAVGILLLMAGIWLGGALGRAADRRLTAKGVAGGPKGATIIPLDTITALRTGRSAGLGELFITETLIVTTADGTEYGFRGRTSHLQAGIASAMASLGREVRATPLGLTVAPRAAVAEG
jgi:hypothetical protein